MVTERNYILREIKQRGSMANFIVGWIISIILAGSFCYISIKHDASLFSNAASANTGIFLLPILLISGLYGYLVALITFLVAFILTLFYNMDNSYSMVIYLAAILSFSLCSQNLWFKNKSKTIGACIITFISITLNEYMCFKAVPNMDYRMESFFETQFYSLYEILTIFLTGMLLHFIFTRTSDRFKYTFPLGVIYTKDYKKNGDSKNKSRKTRFSMKITMTIVTAELILAMGVSFFMMVLFPDIKKMFINEYYRIGNVVVSEESIEDNHYNPNFYKAMAKIEFKVDDAMISFDLKMIMLMLNLGVPFAAFAYYFTTFYMVGPLVDMSDFLDEYAHAHDDDKIAIGRKIDDIRIDTNDEIKTMYDALHDTVHEMEGYIDRMRDKHRLESDLEVAKKANDAKSGFLSNMSHEIRTPINAILGMDEMILRESDDPDILEYAANIKSAGNSLLSIVNDILDFSKIEADKMEIIPVQYNLASVVNDLVNMVSTRALEKGLDIDVDVDRNTPTNLIGDEIRIKQVVTNLLSNAVKYTEKGVVTLQIGYSKIDDNNMLLAVTVKDTGIGIKEEDIKKLYNPFERIEEARNRTIEGTGLGMNIVKRLLSLMGTKLLVESVYGEGSKFSFEVKQQVISWDPIGDFKERYKEFIESKNEYHETFVAQGARILVVDDTEMNLTVIKNLLKKTEINIDTATSGMDTLDLVTKVKYDVIFLDHRMPIMDGIETLENMKAMENNLNKDVPVIALTANAVSGAREEYLAHGFTDYVTKPVNGVYLEKILLHYIDPEKIQAVSINNGEADLYVKDNEAEEGVIAALKGVDSRIGITNCGDEATYVQVVKDFHGSIDCKSGAIEQFLSDGDIRNYTVFVHALKSSARLIGAMELSSMAAELEKCGNEEKIDIIKEKTPYLLGLYRSYKDNLKVVDNNDEGKEEIPTENLISAFKDLKELVEAYDYDTADSIMHMLDEYSIPADYKEKYKKVKELMGAVDRDGLLAIL